MLYLFLTWLLFGRVSFVLAEDLSYRTCPQAHNTKINLKDLCPPMPTGTLTLTKTAWRDVDVVPLGSGIVTEYQNTITLTYRKTFSRDVTYGPASGKVIEYHIDMAPAKTTVTIPFGDTPAICQKGFHMPTQTITVTHVQTGRFVDGRETVKIPGTQTSFDLTSINAGQTSYDGTTTSTLTRSDSTRSIFAACATHCLLPERPRNRLSWSGSLERYGYKHLKDVPASDLVDCCSICHADSDCTLSWHGPVQWGTDTYVCSLYQAGDRTLCEDVFSPEDDEWPSNIGWHKMGGDCGKLSIDWRPRPPDLLETWLEIEAWMRADRAGC